MFDWIISGHIRYDYGRDLIIESFEMIEGNYCRLNEWNYVQDEVRQDCTIHRKDVDRFSWDYYELNREFQDNNVHVDSLFDYFQFRLISIRCKYLYYSNDMMQDEIVSIQEDWQEVVRCPNI